MGAASVTGKGNGSAEGPNRQLTNLLKVLLPNETTPSFYWDNERLISRVPEGAKIVRISVTNLDVPSYYQWDGSNLIVYHNLNAKYVACFVYDETDFQIIPNEVELLGENILRLHLESFVPLTGTFHLVIVG